MKCTNPYRVKTDAYGVVDGQCGKCGACRYNSRVDWTFRIKEEAHASSSVWFLTLTYNEENLPLFNEKTGEIFGGGNLKRSDTVAFMKRLRKHQKKKIRFFEVGEYGTDNERPHYHMVLFNLEKEVTAKIKKIWGKGHVHAVPLDAGLTHYVTKFHVTCDKNKSDKWGRVQEFTNMSRRPGIGHAYLERTHEVIRSETGTVIGTKSGFNKDNKALYVVNNGFKQRLPRYFRKKIFDEEELLEATEAGLVLADERLEAEYVRLEKLGIVNPIREVESRNAVQAEKVVFKEKQKRNNLD